MVDVSSKTLHQHEFNFIKIKMVSTLKKLTQLTSFILIKLNSDENVDGRPRVREYQV